MKITTNFFRIDKCHKDLKHIDVNDKIIGKIIETAYVNKNFPFVKDDNLYNEDGYIVIDTIISDGIELCDILHISNDEIYLVHVKHGFTAKVRELTNQILISARRLNEAISSSNRLFFDNIYDKLFQKKRKNQWA